MCSVNQNKLSNQVNNEGELDLICCQTSCLINIFDNIDHWYLNNPTLVSFLCDLLSDAPVIGLNERKSRITSLNYSSGGQWIVAGFDDKVVRLLQKHLTRDEEVGAERWT